jgi:hypothetical protein
MLRSILRECIHFENCENSLLFIVFIPIIQVECTKLTSVYYQFQDKLYLFIFLTVCLVANLKQRLWSN